MPLRPVETTGGFRHGQPEALFEGDFTVTSGRNFDVTQDGQRFLMVQVEEPETIQLILVRNWLTELNELLSVD